MKAFLVLETLSHDGNPEMIAGVYPWATVIEVPERLIEQCKSLVESDLMDKDVLDVTISQGENVITLREYFKLMLKTLWEKGEMFSGKRPFGQSNWKSEVYEAIGRAGFLSFDFDPENLVMIADKQKANALIIDAIGRL